MISQKIFILIVTFFIGLGLVGCANGNEDEATSSNKETTQNEESILNENTEMEHSGMEHSGSGDIPMGLQEAENPKYQVGSTAIIQEGHMAGMKGAKATIVGAYDTIAYTISYNPTTGGERVTGHKWVIHEEISDAGEQPLEPGTEVVINAGHMEGMEGATAKIDSAEKTTVYMINFTPTTRGKEITNHKWVTESELSPPKND